MKKGKILKKAMIWILVTIGTLMFINYLIIPILDPVFDPIKNILIKDNEVNIYQSTNTYLDFQEASKLISEGRVEGVNLWQKKGYQSLELIYDVLSNHDYVPEVYCSNNLDAQKCQKDNCIAHSICISSKKNNKGSFTININLNTNKINITEQEYLLSTSHGGLTGRGGIKIEIDNLEELKTNQYGHLFLTTKVETPFDFKCDAYWNQKCNVLKFKVGLLKNEDIQDLVREFGWVLPPQKEEETTNYILDANKFVRGFVEYSS